MLFIVFAVVIIGAAGFWLLKMRHPSPPAESVAAAPPQEAPLEPPTFGEVYRFEDLVINPVGGRKVFMVTVVLEVQDARKIAEIQKRESLLRDNLITMFSSQSAEALADIQLRRAFRARVIKIMDYQLGAGTVSRVFFEKWILE
jgi:flagellar basal body-associated protein FliL